MENGWGMKLPTRSYLPDRAYLCHYEAWIFIRTPDWFRNHVRSGPSAS